MNDFTGRIRPDEWQPPVGLKRTLTVALDPAQYQADMTHMATHRSEDVYSTFNLLMRRKPKVRVLSIQPVLSFQMLVSLTLQQTSNAVGRA